MKKIKVISTLLVLALSVGVILNDKVSTVLGENVAGDEISIDDYNFQVKENNEENCVELDWDRPDYKNPKRDVRYSYRVWSKCTEEPDSRWQTIPCNGKVKVLNLYPGKVKKLKDGTTDKWIETEELAGAELEQWMKEPALELAKEDENYDVYINTNKKKYKYITEITKDEEGNEKVNFITNGKGCIEGIKDETTGKIIPYKDSTGNYVYAKDEKGVDKTEQIQVDKMDIRTFNAESINGKNVLMENDEYKYDVIMIGSWDGNNGMNLNDAAIKYVKYFIETGRGILAGHDTIGYGWGTDNGLGKLRDYFKIKVGYWNINNTNGKTDENFKYFGGFIGDEISVKKRGLLTNYPWKIGIEETKLSTPLSHSTSNFAFGDIWMQYSENSTKICADNRMDSGILWKDSNFPKELYENSNFYLTTWNNTAMIQTGHLKGASTPDEQKLLSNTLFYLSQVTADTSWKEHKGQDLTAPDKPNIRKVYKDSMDQKAYINIDAVKDNGTGYDYYIEGTNLADESKSKSQVKSVTVTSGLDKYLVVCDKNKDTNISDLAMKNASKNKEILDGIMEVYDTNISLECSFNENFYIHVSSIDKAGNISETATSQYIYPEILGVESKNESAVLGSCIYTDLTLNNISEDNKSFNIRSLKDILNQNITIKYDTSKLKYAGVTKVNEYMPIININENDGTIVMNVAGEDEDSIKGNVNLLTLKFKALEEGETEISVADGIFTDLNNVNSTLLPVQRGKCKVKITAE